MALEGRPPSWQLLRRACLLLPRRPLSPKRVHTPSTCRADTSVAGIGFLETFDKLLSICHTAIYKVPQVHNAFSGGCGNHQESDRIQNYRDILFHGSQELYTTQRT